MSQATLSKWVGWLPDLAELKKRRLDEREILKLAIEEKANLTREQIRELAYKSAWSGQYFTPKPVAELVACFGDIQADETVFDPACGLGDLMFPALEYTAKVEGIELMQETAQLSSKVLGLKVNQGNTLEQFPDLQQFDVVLANPPFGKASHLDNWDSFELNDGRKSNRLEVLFLELCLKVAKRRVVMIVPDGLLSSRRDQYARKWILENFGYRATISLPSKTFWKSTRNRNKWSTPVSGVKTSIMVIDKVKPKSDYKVLMAILEKPDDCVKVEELWRQVRGA